MENSEDRENGAVYEPSLDKEQNDNVTPFAKAGFFSKMSFWWLNSLMKLGKEKILQNEDIPRLRLEERAETCYSKFMEQLHKEKKTTYDTYSILSAIFYGEWRGILMTGFFALTKVLALSTGPLFLRAFIAVADGEEAFEYEGYVLAGGLFLAKCLESLSERQWFFRARLIGLRIRSFLSAAICQKQLRLSSAAKMTHSPGQIVNYVTSDAYRIGEFPYWFHQIWSTSLQLCLALAIVYYAVGLATLAALTLLILIMFPFGDQTQIGERGVNLSGGQKQRIQLARALYQDAAVYLLDDPFSAVDAHTAMSLFNEYVMEALSGKTVLLVTHQVDFLPAFHSILLMSSGQIVSAGSYDQLMASCQEFQELVNAHNTTAGSGNQIRMVSSRKPGYSKEEIRKIYVKEQLEASPGSQLIKQEEREIGDSGFKPCLQYLKHNKGFLLFTLATISHIVFIAGQLAQNYWLASEINTMSVSTVELNSIYTGIGVVLALFMLFRSYFIVYLGCGASNAIFSVLLKSLIRAPMSFYDSTPLGRILSRVSSDLSFIDVDVAFKLTIALGSTMNTYSSFLILAFLAWPVLFVIIPMIYLTLIIQKYYYASSNELMRLDGTTKSTLASHLTESMAGVMTIRVFGQEDRFFSRSLCLIDANASPYFHSFSANEWLVQRLEVLCAIVLTSSALAITFLDLGSSSSGFVGMALSYGLSLNVFLVNSVQFQCSLSNLIISVERLEQYMHIQSEAPEVIEDSRPAPDWPFSGNVEIYDLKVRYRPDSPLVLHGISCEIKGGHKIGIVGRTGSGKTTLISALFRLVEPTDGKIIVDGLDIATIGLHDLRSHFGVIPQDPTLFGGTVRYNLDPLSEHTDEEIWEVLGKCQLREAIQEKEKGLESPVVQDGSNWSMGQRQLFCLGRALLRRSRILVLDEATASIDNATDSILQRTIRKEFADCTVITVAHRIPTVMDCTMVLAISDGRLVEYDEPMKLVGKEDSLFGQLYKEYWSRTSNASNYSENF
ncbi:hypothetical protein ACJRO7_019744 [Eucalyptus globulus]|uniref:ABC-type xenobiotic transporter n=1 Tax=Eucalyptus globulus TaxID=34317 RepID=A0ABD3KJI1_EUCGL